MHEEDPNPEGFGASQDPKHPQVRWGHSPGRAREQQLIPKIPASHTPNSWHLWDGINWRCFRADGINPGDALGQGLFPGMG